VAWVFNLSERLLHAQPRETRHGGRFYIICGFSQQSAFHMLHQIIIISRFVILEAWRTRLPWIIVTALAVAAGISMFVKELAITESNRVEVAFLAELARLSGVFITALYVVSTMAREFNDRVADLTLSLELPRASYVLGKLVGYGTVTIAISVAAGMLLLPFAHGTGLLTWTLSLVLELWVVVALSLFCIITFNQVMPAASFVLAFYVLARSVGAMQLIGSSPLLSNEGLTHRFTQGLLNALAYALPGLDRFTQTSWLADGGANLGSVGIALGQTVVYVLLLVAAALFDFHRKNF
jgi:ABC-type transport system involved in multi-copper enzyme maturation permease subunit